MIAFPFLPILDITHYLFSFGLLGRTIISPIVSFFSLLSKTETTEKDNNDTTGPKSKSALSPEAALKNNVEYARTIFDWCRWEWSFKGRRGIWDTDFRFETYSLGLVILADTKIDVHVEFDEDRTPQQKRRYFKECLNHREQLQVKKGCF